MERDEFNKKMLKKRTLFSRSATYPVPPDSIESWIDETIGELYFLADAHSKNIQNSDKVSNIYENMKRFMITQIGGELYNEIVTNNLKINNTIIEEETKKRSYLFDYEVIRLTDNSILKPQNIMKTPSDFDTLKASVQKSNNSVCLSKTDRWPFMSDWALRKEIFSAEINIVHGPYNHDKDIIYFIVRKKVYDVPQLSRANIEAEYRMHEERRLMEKFDREIHAKAQTEIKTDTVHTIYTIICNYDAGCTLTRSMFKNHLSKTIVQYHDRGKLVELSVRQFIEDYEKQPLKKWIIEESDLEQILKEMVFTKLAYNYAENIGIMNDPILKKRLQKLKQSYTIREYETNYLLPLDPVTDNDISQHFYQHRQQYITPSSFDVHVFAFNTRHEAVALRGRIAKFARSGNQQFISWADKDVEVTLNEEIKFGNVSYPAKVFKILLTTTDKKMTNPIVIGNKHVIFVKIKSNGRRLAELEEVNDYIYEEIKQIKLKQIKKSLLPQLKQYYIYSNNIDLSFYYNDDFRCGK